MLRESGERAQIGSTNAVDPNNLMFGEPVRQIAQTKQHAHNGESEDAAPVSSIQHRIGLCALNNYQRILAVNFH